MSIRLLDAYGVTAMSINNQIIFYMKKVFTHIAAPKKLAVDEAKRTLILYSPCRIS